MKIRLVALAALFFLFSGIAVGQTTQPGTLCYPTFGVVVSPPAGWAQIPPGSAGEVARWAKGKEVGHITALITLEVEPRHGRTVKQYVQLLAKEKHGTVVSDSLTLGGLPAMHVKLAGEGPGLRLGDGLVAEKGGYFYVLTHQELPDVSASAEFEEVRKTVRIMDPAPPASHLQMSSDPLDVRGHFRMNVPAIMRPYPVADPREMRLGAYNYITGEGEFYVFVQLIDLKHQYVGSFAQMRDIFSGMLHERMGLKKPIAWHDVPGDLVRVICDPIDAPAKLNGVETRGLVYRYAIVRLGTSRFAQLTFTIGASAAKDCAAYEANCDAIVESIVPGGVIDGGSTSVAR